MELEKLKQFKEFISCYDIIEKAYKLCENRNYCYLCKDGCGTYDINNCLDMIEKDGSIETIKGYIIIECHHIYCYVDDKEEKQYNCESYIINSDVKEWY